MKILRLSGACLLAGLLATGCSRTAQPSDTEISSAQARPGAEQPQSGGTAADAPGRSRPPPSQTAAPATTSVDVSGDRSRVKIDAADGGTSVDVHGRGRGSVQVSPTGTTVRGADGRGSVQVSPTGTTVRGPDGSVITVPAAPH